MNELLQKAIKDFPILRSFANRLLGISSKMKTGGFVEDDHFGFMSLSYLFKQGDHLNMILILRTRRDAILIARSMLEGLCQLLWANNDRENLAFRWRAYAYIHDWRLLQKKKADGEILSDEEVHKIEEVVNEYGRMFYSKKTKAAIKKGEKLPDDPYDYNWTGISAWEIFKLVEGKILYKELYSPFSDWHHWNSSGFGKAVKRNEKGLLYQTESITDAATCLAAGFQCLLQTAEVVNDYHKYGITEDILKLKNEYIEILSKD